MHVYNAVFPASDWQVMNEIALHRGSSPHLNTIDVYVDGQHLTEAVVRSLRTLSHEDLAHTRLCSSPTASSYPPQRGQQRTRFPQEDPSCIHP